MRYCQSCDTEYPEVTATCPKCQAALVDAPAKDTRRFVLAGTTEDPLSAENLAEVVDGAGIPVLVRARRRGVVEPITSSSLHAWWEILVPEELLDRAQAVLEKERQQIEADAGEAAQAAEEEEAQGEKLEAEKALAGEQEAK
jgi:hypothetical protein